MAWLHSVASARGSLLKTLSLPQLWTIGRRVAAMSGPASDTNLGGQIDGSPMPTGPLNSGFSIPLVGLGTWGAELDKAKAAVETAIRLGYRHIDCAAVYQNQQQLGEGLQTIFKEGVVPREELFVTSKLWNNAHDLVEEACRLTLSDLKLDYLDLYLMHWPVTNVPGPSVHPPLVQTWSAMEALVDKGWARSIGVSNFSIVKLEQLLKGCRIKPAVNQVEAHPYFRNDALLKYCKEQGIHVTAYSPLGSVAKAVSEAAQSGSPAVVTDDPVVRSIATKLGKTPAQVLIRWGLQRGTSVIPKSANPEHLRSNLDVLGWELAAENFEALSNLPIQSRVITGDEFLKPEGPYRSLQELWDEDIR